MQAVASIDPYPVLRSLCPRDASALLREAGVPVSMALESTCIAREEHAILILDNCTLVEVNCNSYLDRDNHVRISRGHPGTRHGDSYCYTASLLQEEAPGGPGQ